MREIKFRAWCIHPESDSYFFEYFGPTHGLDIDPLVELVGNIEQYTGLKDKNGKEIYEGDIVEGDGLTAEVIYSKRWAEFKLVGANSLGWYDYTEIIGNIHKNPELLESKC